MNVLSYSCQNCSKNTFSSISGAERCLSCPVGRFTLTSGSTECSECEESEVYSSFDDRCLCRAGYEKNPIDGNCSVCGPNLVKEVLGDQRCQPCSPDRGERNGTSCVCRSGLYEEYFYEELMGPGAYVESESDAFRRRKVYTQQPSVSVFHGWVLGVHCASSFCTKLYRRSGGRVLMFLQGIIK